MPKVQVDIGDLADYRRGLSARFGDDAVYLDRLKGRPFKALLDEDVRDPPAGACIVDFLEISSNVLRAVFAGNPDAKVAAPILA